MSEYVYLIVVLHGVVEEVIRFTRENVHVAEQTFVHRMGDHIHNFMDYSVEDVQACVEDGFEGFGGGDCSIQLHWSDG